MKRTPHIAAIFAFFISANAWSQQCACQAPNHWTGSVCIPPTNANNACDDGSLSGTPSLVSANVPGATPLVKFQSVVNKKLACCMNSFDPAAPTQLKYDCVDNSKIAFTSFDDIWTRTDSVDSGLQPYGLVLTTGGSSGSLAKPISGFYTMGGSHCDEFSEFAGPIRQAKVNPGQISGQMDLATSSGGEACAIVPGTYSVQPTPSALTAGVVTSGKTVPYDGTSTHDCAQAQNMRRCPILVRAAMVSACPRNPILPGAQTTYLDSLGVSHCLAAATVRVFMRIEQIYEVAGMPTMPVIDTYQTGGINTNSISTLIQNKVGNACPGGTSLLNGSCMGCSAGCAGTMCSPCSAGTFSSSGDIHCSPCPVGQYSGPGSANCSACTNTPPGFYWTSGASSPTGCATTRCNNTGTGFGGLGPNCP